jgi:serine/threonine-protein kinase RsbW
LPHVNESITLEIPAKAEYVVLGRLALAGLLRERAFTADAVADLKLALTEACSNSIRHAYNGNGAEADAGQVALSFEMQNDRLVMTIRDDGAGFHEDDVDCPQCAAVEGAAHLSEGGMGISIIRAVVDEFSLEWPPEGGTMLVLTKRRDI